MSDIAHRLDTKTIACACGSQWNWINEACSSLVPIPTHDFLKGDPEEDWDNEYFECRKGHAFCGRH